MAATVSSVFRSYGVRSGSFLELISKTIPKLGVVTISFGASDTYSTGGIAVSSAILSALNFDSIIAAVPMDHTVSGYQPHYDAANGKIQFFGTGSSAGALGEMSNGSTAIQSKSVKLLVFGE